jgi:nucleoside-diphosphate-sugar epimerase
MPQLGSLDHLGPLVEAAAAADGVVHLALNHDAGFGTDEAVETDLRVVGALGDALAGSGAPLVVTSGTMMTAGRGDPATEDVRPVPDPARPGRVDVEALALGLAERGVRSSIVRLAPTVHGPTDRHGFIPRLIGFAREAGRAAYVGDGAARWPAVHNLDAAQLFRLALEKAPAGAILHAAAENGIPYRDIAAAIGRGLGVPVVGVAPEEASGPLGFLAGFVAIDNPTSSARTQELLGWHPAHPGLLADLDAGFYFERA